MIAVILFTGIAMINKLTQWDVLDKQCLKANHVKIKVMVSGANSKNSLSM